MTIILGQKLFLSTIICLFLVISFRNNSKSNANMLKNSKINIGIMQKKSTDASNIFAPFL